MSNFVASMTSTNNPYIDYLLYYTKLLSFGSVIKDEDLAQQYETKESILNGDALISCIEGTSIFELFKYDEELLRASGITDKIYIQKCMEDSSYIPDDHAMIVLTKIVDSSTATVTGGTYDGTTYNLGDYISIAHTSNRGQAFKNYKVTLLDDGRVVAINNLHNELAERATKKYIYNYHEINNYYRKLAGLPNLGDPGIPIIDYEYIDIAGNTIKQFINTDHVTYVHELTPEQISYLDEKGVLDIMRMDYPDADYLDFITNKIVDFDSTDEESVKTYNARKFYKLRKAYNFQLVYVPDLSGDSVIEEKFKKKYEENRLYVIHTYYTDAFKSESKYYTSFMAMMIMIMTMTDMLSEVHEHIIKKDFLDKRCIQYIFEQYGLPYFTSIPIKYQFRMCKNINQLIRYKSCTTGMLNIIDLFGAENIDIFKYFILRDRNVDKWGNLIYNEIVTKNSRLNDILVEEDRTAVVTSNKIAIPFPVKMDDYIGSGNKMLVYDENNKIINYVLSPDKKYITLNKYNNRTIHFKFIYNKETIKPYIDTDNAIKLSYEKGLVENKNLKLNNLPSSSFLVDGNEIAVLLDGKLLINSGNSKDFIINSDSNILTFSFTPRDNNAIVIYAYNKNFVTKLYNFMYEIDGPDEDDEEEEGKEEFVIPTEVYFATPFTDYIKRGNSMIVLYRTSDESKSFKILKQDTDYVMGNDNYITLKFTPSIGNVFNFVFIYSKNAEYYPVDINVSTEQFVGEEAFQTEFKLHPPFDHYFEKGYKAYPRLRNNDKMLNTDLYDIYNNTLNIRNQSLGLQVGQKMEVTYVYGPDTENISITKQTIVPKEDDQYIFTDLDFPCEDFFEKGNDIIVDVIGDYLRKNIDYTVDEKNKTLTILDPFKIPDKTQYVGITYYTADTSNNCIKCDVTHINATDSNTEFPLSLPFTPYVSTGHSVLAFHTNDESTEFVENVLLNDTSINVPLEKINAGDVIDVLSIYNSGYVNKASSYITFSTVAKSTTDDIENDLSIKVPYPFENYEENGWITYITDENNKIISDDDYSIIDGYFNFNDPNDLLSHTTVKFNFAYYNNERYIYTYTTEDVDKDFTLKFVGVPIENPYFNKGIINLTNELSYDSVTKEDRYWDGVAYSDDLDVMHKEVKNQILQKKFNYERTKYYGLNYVYDIANMTFQIAYFYNIFYDDVFKENKLTLSIPSIISYKKFSIANLFVYMTALAYLYSGASDHIVDTTSKILYIKGFNFKADIDKLKKWIWDKRRNPDNFDTTYYYGTRPTTLAEPVDMPTDRTKNIWEFDTLKNSEFKNLDQLVDMLTSHNDKKLVSNADIYNFIVKSIYESQDYDIFCIWKKIFDSLMTYRESYEFYKITDDDGVTRIAKSMTEFLRYKDTELYNDLQDIKYINDVDQRNEKIINRITDIVYLLEEFIDLKTFTNIFDMFPGVSGDFFLDMLFTIINFFKSYKIVLRSKGDYIIFSAKDPYLNTLRFLDTKDNEVEKDLYDYIYIHPKKTTSVILEPIERIKLKEHINTTEKINDISNTSRTDLKQAQINNGLPLTNRITCTIKAQQNQTITILKDDGTKYISSPTKDISFSLKYGEGIYTYISANTGYNTGVLNKRYVRAENDDIIITATNATRIKLFVDIEANPNIHLKITDVNTKKVLSDDNRSFIIDYGTKIKIDYTVEKGFTYDSKSIYVNNSLYRGEFFVETNIKIETNDPMPEKFNVTMIAPDNVTLICTFGDEVYTVESNQTLKKIIFYGTKYRILMRVNSDYDGGTLIGYNNKAIAKSGTMNYDIARNGMNVLITSTNPTIKKFLVSILQSDNQTIYVNYMGIDYTKDFYATIHSKVTVDVVAKTGYKAGRPSFTESVIIENTVISATPAAADIFSVIINTPDMTDAEFMYINSGESYIEDIPKNTNKIISGLELNDSYSIQTFLSSGTNVKKYSLGNVTPYTSKINKDNSVEYNGTINHSISDNLNRIKFTIDPVIINTFIVNINNPEPEKQRVHYTYKDKTYDDTMGSKYIEYGTTLNPVVTVLNNDYNPGEISDSVLIESNTDISVGVPVLKRYKVTIAKYDNQIITLTDSNGFKYTDDFYGDIHTSYTVSIESKNNQLYTAGTLNTTSITDLTKDITINATNATMKVYTIKIGPTNHQILKFTINGKTYGANTTFKATAGSTYTAKLIADDGYTAGVLNIFNNGVVTGDMNIEISDASKK